MTDLDIAHHNALCIELTAADSRPRLSWEQHTAVFATPVTELAIGQQVAAWDSATAGIVTGIVDGEYAVQFADLGPDPVVGYTADQLRTAFTTWCDGHCVATGGSATLAIK